MRDAELGAMIKALKIIQEEEYITLEGLALRLGFSASHISMVFSGKRQPGIRFVRAVIEHFPQIRQVMAESLKFSTEDEG